ncbi:cdkn1a interacting zinc finger protein 1b isoform X2 [Genypterus blacodes]|uniref:cdkn1a interacting zinc finger protein 1b isoform X2 n=1 Tax=Genypterus blacodes TaxID=154954 RepID=UPI003F765AAF
MVKQSDRCLLPAAGSDVSLVQFPAGAQRRKQVSNRKWAGPGSGTNTEEGDGRGQCGWPGPDGSSGWARLKRQRLDGPEQPAAATNGGQLLGSCGPPGESSVLPPPDHQGAAELCSESRAAELQTVGSLKVTIQQSSESREFGQKDRQTCGLHCHVCNSSCRTLQAFQEHMAGSEHQQKLKELTHSISLTSHTLQGRGPQADMQRWCESCQEHFSGDIIIHRRTKQHKLSKQQSRPFCPVCKRHFRTPRKFVEHMKSAEHKQQVQQEEEEEEELITVDAVGCFEGEEEEEVEVGDEEEDEAKDEDEAEATDRGTSEEYNPHTTYGSSFVVPVSGFLCQLCRKFFHKEATARHTHCRTRTHYTNLQVHTRTHTES